MMPPERRTKLPSWAIPAGVVGGGLASLAALAALKRGKIPKPKALWNWEMEMLGRGGKRFQSQVHPGEVVGHGYGPGVEEVATKLSSAPLRPVDIICGLGAIARQ
jgi:DNA-binding transcriptional regulator LsrR (DeoR family)